MVDIENTARSTTRFQRVLLAYRETFSTVGRSPVTWLIVGLTVLASVYLILVGKSVLVLGGLATLGANGVLALLVIPLTRGKPKAVWENPPTTYSRQRLWVQFVVCVLVILLLQAFLILAYDLFNLRTTHLPLLSSLASFIYAQSVGRNYLFILPSLFVLESVLPIGLMRLLGASWGELGFGKGYHVWRVSIVLNFLYLVGFGVVLVSGQTTIFAILLSIGRNFFLDGFTEETLYRGVLFTRVTQLFGVAWGVGISGLLFGLLHFSITMSTFHNSVPLTLSFVMIHYALNGMFAAFFFLRTRNLTANVIFHTLGDATTQFIGL